MRTERRRGLSGERPHIGGRGGGVASASTAALLRPAAAPSPAHLEMDPTWGTRKRIATLIESLGDEDIDQLIDKSTRFGGAPRFITRFHPQATWLWRQWQGTVLEQTWQPAATVMLLSAFLCGGMELGRTWPILHVPSEDNYIVMQLRGINNMWGYLLTMAGFVNSFFLSQACARPPRRRFFRVLARRCALADLRRDARDRARRQTASGSRPRVTRASSRVGSTTWAW